MTISSLADLNGDGLRDVAVGAPLEDNNRGAVYIYLGNKHTGIRHANSQVSTNNRVTGSHILSVHFIDDAYIDKSSVSLEPPRWGWSPALFGQGLKTLYSHWRILSSIVFQRITADPANARIRFFGQAVDGQIDLGEDGLPDLVVGSRGAVFILKYVYSLQL